MSFSKAALLTLVVLFLFLICFLIIMEGISGGRGKTSPLQENISEVKSQEMARKRAETFFSQDKNLKNITYRLFLFKKEAPLFKHHTIYLVVAKKGSDCLPLRNLAVAVGDDNETFLLPDEFNEVVRRERIRVNSEREALEIVHAYVDIPSPFETRILSNASEIPGIEVDTKVYKELNRVIRPPEVKEENGGYIVRFFGWCLTGGSVDEWVVRIERNGTIVMLKMRNIMHIKGWGGLLKMRNIEHIRG